MSDSFSIHKTIKGTLPRVPFADIKECILGSPYELSLVFIGEKRSQNLNRDFRKKDKPTNILSFPLAKDAGEIFLNYPRIQKEAKAQGFSFNNYIGYLFIHGLLHLDGHDHGSTMDSAERRWCSEFSIPYPWD